MTWTRPAYMGLAWLFMLCVLLQFFFAGLFVLGGESIDLHEAMGYMVLHLIPILMFVVAIIGKMGRKMIGLTFLLFALVFIQPIFVEEDLDGVIRALHVPMALIIAALGHHLAHTATQAYKGASVAA